MTYKARRAWALVVLLIGMPVYVIIALNVMARIDRLPIWAEVPVYILLGTAWIWPFKRVFTGIGQADPDEVGSNRDA
jgi:predicted membrane channel-forming protein YqfA (hemolysin III family)